MSGAIEVTDYRDMSGAMETGGNMTREEVLGLMKQKDEYEAELAAMAEVLKTQGCGMEEPLVDAEGIVVGVGVAFVQEFVSWRI